MQPFLNYKTGGIDFTYERALLFRDLLTCNGFDQGEVQSLFSAIVALWLRGELALLKERSRGKYTHRVDYTRFSLRSGLRGLYDYGVVSLYTAPVGWRSVLLSFPDEILRRLMIPANGLFQVVSSYKNTLYLLDGVCEGVYVGVDGVLAPTINKHIAQSENFMGYRFQFLLETVFEGILTYIFESIRQTMYQNDVKVSWVGVDGLTLCYKDTVDVNLIVPPELRGYMVEPRASMLEHFLY